MIDEGQREIHSLFYFWCKKPLKQRENKQTKKIIKDYAIAVLNVFSYGICHIIFTSQRKAYVLIADGANVAGVCTFQILGCALNNQEGLPHICLNNIKVMT